jgi:DNA polymerase epsilon subunit 1
MVEAYRTSIIFPNKILAEGLKFHGNHLLDSETYVGGHVEALAAGVYRNDIPLEFKIKRDTMQTLIEDIDQVISFAAKRNKFNLEECTNYDDVRTDILTNLIALRDVGSTETENTRAGFARRKECCTIVHLDVAAMYPNIILSNRLQPQAIVNEEICAACCHNKVENDCKRLMEWKWRGEVIPATRHEYNLIKTQIESERFTVGGEKKHYFELPRAQQIDLLKARLKEYSRKVYKKLHQTTVLKKVETICMRENSFYVETVRAFRDRRYVYKGLLKKWQLELGKAKGDNGPNEARVQECEKMVVMYDSMQLAHKCILNSFYGYVMRKGSRWQSMEMAGVVTRTGHQVIAQARDLLSAVGHPLELDTDGVWTALPATFPANFKLKGNDNKALTFSYPCELLNRMTALKFSNPQYQKIVPQEDGKGNQVSNYTAHSVFSKTEECSIEFEVDGPYKAMVLPASKEKGKSIKKRYAVFHLDGKLAELKGFEMKRRGELKLIKSFQATVFSYFLHGENLTEVYSAVGEIAQRFLSYLTSRGESMTDEEILDLLTESSNMSRGLASYAGARTCQVTTAKRLAEFLGPQIAQTKGLKCAYVIARRPYNTTVTDRALPITIFGADDATKTLFLSKWLKCSPGQHQNNLREIIDWDYYTVRLESCIQKLITIPCILQGVANPLPNVAQPDWLAKEAKLMKARGHQANIVELFGNSKAKLIDIESLGGDDVGGGFFPRKKKHIQKKSELSMKKRIRERYFDEEVPDMDKKFDHWLAYMKRFWRVLREERRKKRSEQSHAEGEKEGERERDGGGHQTQVKRKHVSVPRFLNPSLTDFFARKDRELLKMEWHVVHIAETAVPGHYRVWALVGKTLTSVSLAVPRTLYINSFVEFPQQDTSLTRAHAFPPRSHPELFLYKKTVSEKDFINSSASLSALSLGTEIEGIYETKLPLDFHAMIEIGAVCRVKPDVKRKAVAQLSFGIDDLMRQSDAAGYLAGDTFDLVFLYHVHKGQEAVMGLYQLFTEEEEVERQKATVITVNPFPETNSNVVKLLRDRVPHLEVTLFRETTPLDGFAVLGQQLRALQENTRKPTFLVIQSDSPTISSLLSVPALQEFPYIRMPFNESDGSVSMGSGDDEATSFFGRWQGNAVGIMQKRSSEVTPWFESQLECARMANIPIGNFDDDYLSTILDVQFARALRENQYILWASNSFQPDLGGNVAEAEIVAPSTPQETVHEGCYSDGISVTLEMNALSIDAIIEASTIAELEGTTHIFSALMPSPLLDKELSSATQLLKTTDGSEISRQFFLLRQLVSKWVKEVEDCSFNDLLLSHLPRWIGNRQSRLFEPALAHLVDTFMKKVFLHLVMEFEKLGTKVAYASYDKLIISTNKKTIIDAREHLDFLLGALRKKPLFEFLSLSPIQFWFPIIFLDRHNFAGVCYQDTSNEDEQLVLRGRRLEDSVQTLGTESNLIPFQDGKKGKLLSSWNIGDYLPESVRSLFLVLIGEYILNVKAFSEAHTENDLPKLPEKNFAHTDDFKFQEEDDEASVHFNNNVITQLLPNSLQERMFMTVKQLHTTQPITTTILPLTSSSSQLTNPALAYINFSVRILELDKRLSGLLRRLKKNLLSTININEFSTEAKFEYPCRSFVIPAFYCSYCNACQYGNLIQFLFERFLIFSLSRDLDLLRDSQLLTRSWKCFFCKKPYCNCVSSLLVFFKKKIALILR